MSVNRIAVFFRDTAEGRRELAFACSFSLTTKIPLAVLLPSYVYGKQYWGIETARVIEHVRSLGVNPVVQRFNQEHFELPSNVLLVSNDPPSGEFSVLRPFEESKFDRANSGVMVVPFGHGDAGRKAAHFAIEFAKDRGVGIVFYHTTWRSNIVSTDPKDHMSPEARRTCCELEDLAREANITFTTVIETADDVVEGFMLCALKWKAAFVVVAHAEAVIQGSYVYQVVEMGGASPILVVGTGVTA